MRAEEWGSRGIAERWTLFHASVRDPGFGNFERRRAAGEIQVTIERLDPGPLLVYIFALVSGAVDVVPPPRPSSSGTETVVDDRALIG
jgi:hypothetical protein